MPPRRPVGRRLLRPLERVDDALGSARDRFHDRPVQFLAGPANRNILAANPDIDLIMGLNDSMALGAYNVVKGKPAYDNVM
jgi:hypothetical protein